MEGANLTLKWMDMPAVRGELAFMYGNWLAFLHQNLLLDDFCIRTKYTHPKY